MPVCVLHGGPTSPVDGRHRPSLVLARSGQVSTVSEIKTSLARDGFSINQLDGPSLRRQLIGLIRASRPGAAF